MCNYSLLDSAFENTNRFEFAVFCKTAISA
jgi:hypothetical protein